MFLVKNIKPDTLKELLFICTQCTPFKFDEQLYIQTDGVSMGSPLGPTFADFFTSQIERHILSSDISKKMFFPITNEC